MQNAILRLGRQRSNYTYGIIQACDFTILGVDEQLNVSI